MATYATKLRQQDGPKIAEISTDGSIQVKNNGTLSSSVLQAESSSTTVAADVLAIPLTAALVLKTTGADAEALTLADGYPGQVMTINLVVDGGGTGTLTPTTTLGWSAVAFADAGDSVTIKYENDTVGWVLLSAYGLTAQPTISA